MTDTWAARWAQEWVSSATRFNPNHAAKHHAAAAKPVQPAKKPKATHA